LVEGRFATSSKIAWRLDGGALRAKIEVEEFET
jgi:hypothetical protein